MIESPKKSGSVKQLYRGEVHTRQNYPKIIPTRSPGFEKRRKGVGSRLGGTVVIMADPNWRRSPPSSGSGSSGGARNGSMQPPQSAPAFPPPPGQPIQVTQNEPIYRRVDTNFSCVFWGGHTFGGVVFLPCAVYPDIKEVEAAEVSHGTPRVLSTAVSELCSLRGICGGAAFSPFIRGSCSLQPPSVH